uniref:homoserine kinase n=1 Tax=uncultured Sphingomonas sp. TaxID=158754 RepID=UPI0035CB80DD
MAVYTPVSAELLAAFLARYDVGELVSAKGIAEGVQNTNYLVDTTTGRFILTLYEQRTESDELPYFMDMLDHLAARGNPVPPAIKDRGGVAIQTLEGRRACLIQFLSGVSVTHPTAAQAFSTGQAMGRMHAALADFTPVRANSMGIATWAPQLASIGTGFDTIAPGLQAEATVMLETVLRDWPAHLPTAPIHADLFPDNVLTRGDQVTGLIDFYFACTDIRAFDVAILHTAWSFDADGRTLDHAVGRALIEGYDATFGLSAEERAQLGTLAKGACLRFFLSRAWDWLNTPADALVTRKDPLAYLRRYRTYAALDDLFA